MNTDLKSLLEKRAEKLAEEFAECMDIAGEVYICSTRELGFKRGRASTHEIICLLAEVVEFYSSDKSHEKFTNISIPPNSKLNRITTDYEMDKGKKAKIALSKLRAELGDAE